MPTYDSHHDLANIREDFARVQRDFEDLCTVLVTQAERELRGLPPMVTGYKLADVSVGAGMVALDTSPIVDDSTMSAEVPFAASHGRDRVGDFLEVGGILTDNHRRNPVAMLDHGKRYALPIGQCESPEGEYTVRIDTDQGIATARVFFAQDEMGEQIFHLWKARILRAGSIGYRILRAAPLPADPARGFPAGKHLIEVELLEVSIVGLPANPDAVKDALGGFSLVPPLRDLLDPARPRPTLRRKPVAPAAPLVARPALRRRVATKPAKS